MLALVKFVLSLLLATACLSTVTASPLPAPAPAPGLGIPLLSGGGGGGESSSNASSSPLAILDNLSALGGSPSGTANAVEAPVADPATAGGLTEPLKPLSLLGRVVAYRREHRERDVETDADVVEDQDDEVDEYERDAAPAMKKRAERFQLAMMRRATAARA